MVFDILLWSGACLLIMLVPFMILPMRIGLFWQSDPTRRMQIWVRPFGGAFWALPVYDSRRPSRAKQARTKQARTRKERKMGRARGLSPHLPALRDLPRVAGRVIGSVRVQTLRVDADFGLGDPGDTGQLYGQLTPLIYGSGGQITLRPDFSVARLQGRAEAQVQLVPIVFLWPILGFLWQLFRPFR